MNQEEREMTTQEKADALIQRARKYCICGPNYDRFIAEETSLLAVKKDSWPDKLLVPLMERIADACDDLEPPEPKQVAKPTIIIGETIIDSIRRGNTVELDDAILIPDDWLGQGAFGERDPKVIEAMNTLIK